jgi:S-DNA-T family DNA segregation ATPase FtsK/SpoIIIE
MEKRYELFRQLGHRNIESFNNRKPNQELEATLEMEVPKHLSYIVLIIDEFADLMMVSSSAIETPIARIAQMARAVGIHMILATQRPSREVITGLIKANFPSRIAFKVASRINSQIILDDTGAESLLGNGDLLFMPPGTSSLMRAQGAFIRDEDIHKVIEFVTAQAPARYLIPSFRDFQPLGAGGEGEDEGSQDEFYNEAKKIVLETGNASTTFLQRKLKMGYARAASLMDALEKNGVIGPQEGAKPRKIYYPSSQNDET